MRLALEERVLDALGVLPSDAEAQRAPDVVHDAVDVRAQLGARYVESIFPITVNWMNSTSAVFIRKNGV